MNYESQNIEYKHCGMSVYITRRKGLFGENDGVNDGVKVTGNKNIATDDDHINDHINDHVNDTVNDGVKNIDNEKIVLKKDTVNDTINDGVNDGVKWTRNELRILDEMVHNNDITYIELQTKLKISEPTVRRAIKRLRINMMIVREGSDKSGHWYVTEKGKGLLK